VIAVPAVRRGRLAYPLQQAPRVKIACPGGFDFPSPFLSGRTRLACIVAIPSPARDAASDRSKQRARHAAFAWISARSANRGQAIETWNEGKSKATTSLLVVHQATNRHSTT
jgi:hypothetical protein